MINLLKTEKECIEYIHSASRFGKKAGLGNIRALLNALGSPYEKLKCIHIAGTNGKGSVSNMVASVLVSKGYKVGMNTSPFIEVFHERLTVNGENIPAEKLIYYTNLVADAIKKLPDIHPIEFEIITAMGFLYFRDEKCDYVVLECGLGGLYDCTNVIENPIICAITSIGLDHTEILGSTIEEIAFQKAGIIKENVPVVLHPQIDKKALGVIKEYAKEKNAPVIITDGDCEIEFMGFDGTRIKTENEDFTIGLLGSFQPYNAILSANILKQMGICDISDGMLNAKWKCRFERVKDDIIIDGAHNMQGISAFCESAKMYLRGKKTVLILGMLNDKDFDGSAKLLSNLGAKIIVTDVPSYRQTEGKAVFECIRRFCPDAIYEPDNETALKRAMNLKGENGFLCVTGSLYLAGNLRKIIKSNQ